MKHYAGSLEFKEERLCIIDRNGCREQMLSVLKLRTDCRFVQMTEIQPGSIPEHLPIEGWLTVCESNREP